MRLSVVIPTHRDTPKARARLLWASSWASDAVEVVIRDNSGSAAKRAWLSEIGQANCNIVSVDPCPAYTNFNAALALAKGDFVLFHGDDDAAFDRGIAAFAVAADATADDASVAGLTGAYALEERQRSHLVSYAGVDSADVLQRVDGFVGYQGPNLMFYSAVRRTVAEAAFGFMERHPFQMPFRDNVFTLIYLLAGRFPSINRLAFIYDNANWDSVEQATANDLRYYAAAGLDPAIHKLHWLLCGFEGASVAMRSRFALPLAPAQRQAVAARWFELMFRRFVGSVRQGPALAAPAQMIVDRLLGSYPNFQLETLLGGICDYMALFSAEHAQAYGRFWREVAAEAGL